MGSWLKATLPWPIALVRSISLSVVSMSQKGSTLTGRNRSGAALAKSDW